MTAAVTHITLCKIPDCVDYIPLLSTAKGLTELFHRWVTIAGMNPKAVAASHCFTALSQKSVARSLLICVPILGNIAVALYDFLSQKKSNETEPQTPLENQKASGLERNLPVQKPNSPPPTEEALLEAVRSARTIEDDENVLARVPISLRDDHPFMLQLVRMNPSGAFDIISDRLKNCPRFMSEAIKTWQGAFQPVISHASPELKRNHDFAIAALQQTTGNYRLEEELRKDRAFLLRVAREVGELAIQNIDRSLLNDSDFMIQLIDANPTMAWLVGFSPLNNNREFMRAIVAKDGLNIGRASPDLKKDKELALLAIAKSPSYHVLEYFDSTLRDDEEVVTIACKRNKQAIQYASDRLRGKLAPPL